MNSHFPMIFPWQTRLQVRVGFSGSMVQASAMVPRMELRSGKLTVRPWHELWGWKTSETIKKW